MEAEGRMVEESSHSFLKNCFPSSSIFLRLQPAAGDPNFYNGWRRAAMILLVYLLSIFWVEVEGRRVEKYIHP